jgi:hypothetical protein
VYTAFGLDAVNSYTYLYDDLLGQGITVFIVTSDFDQLNGPAGQQAWMATMHWDGYDDFFYSKRYVYWYASDDILLTPINKAGAYFKSNLNLNFIIV